VNLNFHPIFNLKFVSKAIEKTVATQVNAYINENNMNEVLQSAYKEKHSTETALLKVHDDVLRALDRQKSVLLLLLDLSSAFDTVDHNILLDRLSRRFGIPGTACTELVFLVFVLEEAIYSRKRGYFIPPRPAMCMVSPKDLSWAQCYF